jgi:hypothetical protein
MKSSIGLPAGFSEVLKLIAEAGRRLRAEGSGEPVLVGGAAVEIYTGGAIASRDFDLTVVDQEKLEAELIELGFERDNRSGSQRGLWHPKYGYGLEVVADVPFEGKSDAKSRVRYDTGLGSIVIVAVEDLIADRIAQFDSVPRGDQSRLNQAIALYVGAERINEPYLSRRIKEEAHGRDLDWFLKQVQNSRLAKS